MAVQSMNNTNTMDTEACVAQIRQIHAAGCDIVRLTAPGKREAANLETISALAKANGLADVAIVADIHFTPDAAIIAAQYADKVRINPGNYDIARLPELLALCKKRHIPIRIGVNHGSLSAQMVEKYGDTPLGMVESAMEFLRECRRHDFLDVVVSMKSSNVRVMVHAYRLLAAAMTREGMNFPLHLGITEAGDGAEGRIRSDFADRHTAENAVAIENESLYTPFEYSRRKTTPEGNIGGSVPILYKELNPDGLQALDNGRIAVIEAVTGNAPAEWRANILNMMAKGDKRPVILHKIYSEPSIESLRIKAACDFGMAFIDGLADGIWIENDNIPAEEIDSLALSILQAARVRITKTEYIACPGCGRTQFDLQSTLAAVRAQTSHLNHLKIAVMGCIVNGPGEMADADYGYVGAGGGRITLYKGKEVMRRAIPQTEAVPALIELIKSCGDWKDPE